ncbi:CRISPR-associated endonuclease Cas2 [Candidatus Dojkabacteria bacterium]|nr:CRISPR-associated endonuclease Cas2 [Candidatus Dojkabacteria bacterium]
MYLIVIYDVEAKKCSKLHKYLKTQLNWVQNSVFEGQVTDAEYKIIKNELKKKINKEEDSVIFYNLGNEKWLDREVIGVEKNEITNMI